MADLARSVGARRRREATRRPRGSGQPDPAPGRDDTLALFFDALPPGAVPGVRRRPGRCGPWAGSPPARLWPLFLVPEATMAQRISRAKRTVAESGARFALPDEGTYAVAPRPGAPRRSTSSSTRATTSSAGPDLDRTDLAAEAIRLGRLLHELVPDEPEASGLLALMLLTEARRVARTAPDGSLIPLAGQDRARWGLRSITEGTALATAALEGEPVGEYALQAAVAGVARRGPREEDTDWERILALYSVLETMSDNPVMRLNRAVAVAMVEGPDAGLALLDDLSASGQLRSHRLHAVRAHLLERTGDTETPVPRSPPRRSAPTTCTSGSTSRPRRRRWRTATSADGRIRFTRRRGVAVRLPGSRLSLQSRVSRTIPVKEPESVVRALRKGDETTVCLHTRRPDRIATAAAMRSSVPRSSLRGSSSGASRRTQPRARRPLR